MEFLRFPLFLTFNQIIITKRSDHIGGLDQVAAWNNLSEIFCNCFLRPFVFFHTACFFPALLSLSLPDIIIIAREKPSGTQEVVAQTPTQPGQTGEDDMKRLELSGFGLVEAQNQSTTCPSPTRRASLGSMSCPG